MLATLSMNDVIMFEHTFDYYFVLIINFLDDQEYFFSWQK